MPRGTTTALGAVVLLPLLVAASARAQGTIADPPVTFTRPVSSFDAAPAAHFTGVSADPMDDHVFETGWWYRIAGDTAEKFFPAPNVQNYAGDTSTITWNDVDNRGFRAVETAVVIDGGGPSGQVLFTMTLTNLSPTAALTIDLFHMTDLDLGGTTEGDVATLLNANERIQIADAADTAEYGAQGAEAFLVLPYDTIGITDVAGRLSNTAVDDFDNSGLPSGPADLSAGFQWPTVVIPAGGTAVYRAGIAVNMPLGLPLGSTTTTTSTTSTTLPPGERCDDCADGDGDGAVDFEDAECCTPAALTLGRSTLRPREAGVAAVRIKAKLAASPLADGDPTQDVTLQIRGTGGVLCARIPGDRLVRRGKRLLFRDREAQVPTARGITAVTITEKRNGAKLVVSGRQAQLAVLGPGSFTVTLGLRDPASAEAGNRCAAATAAFRAAKRGVRHP